MTKAAQTVTATTCAYCGVGCGVLATVEGSSITVAGDPAHPSNSGRLCSKGSALADTLGTTGRLLRPQIAGRDASWDDAIDLVATRFRETIAAHGPDSVAFYVSGQLLTEDYYVANKFMKGFIGSANIDTNSRLCMSSAVVAHQRAFGEDVVPGCYEDFELADLIVLVGSNAAWCHPILYRRIEQARLERPSMRVVVIDPRRTPTTEIADLHLAIRSGTDVTLFLGLLAWLEREGKLDAAFIDDHTTGAVATLEVARASGADPERVAMECGLDRDDIEAFYRLFSATERVVTAFSQGVNQSSSGTDKATSIINLHLATGRIGKPGAGPFSITGQPNAMGGREVGGMASMLAAHLDIDNEAHRRTVQEFWNSPRIASRPGLKAVDMFDAVRDGRIKAIWIMATNPAVSMPDADRVRDALAACDFVVVSDCVRDTDTTALAHVLLPAAAWGEKDGTTTNSERRISRQRAFRAPYGNARPDWWIMSRVASRMGFGAAFAYDSPRAIFDEHARLSGVANHAKRAFDIGGLAGLSAVAYDNLAPLRWPIESTEAHDTPRLFGDGQFFHADGRARLVATPPRAPVHATSSSWPLVLNSGRIRDQWHTMTRTGSSARLAGHLPEPFADLHPDDAAEAEIEAGDLVTVSTKWGEATLRARSSGEVSRGSVFVPIHWSATNSSSGRVGALTSPAVDARSGEPEFKHTPARIARADMEWHGVLLRRVSAAIPNHASWWVLVHGEGHVRIELAGCERPRDWASWSRNAMALGSGHAEIIEYSDDASLVYRAAGIIGGRLEACVFVARRNALPSRAWLGAMFASATLEDRDRMALLAGRPASGDCDTSPLVCSCFNVRSGEITAAIEREGLATDAEVTACTRAGGNCGSCLPEIRALLHRSALAHPAAA